MRSQVLITILVILSGCSTGDYKYEHIPYLKEKLTIVKEDGDEEQAAWLEGIIAHLERTHRIREESRERHLREQEEKKRLEIEARKRAEQRQQEVEEAHRRWFASLTPDQQFQWYLQQQQIEFLEKEFEKERQQQLTIANQIKNWQEAKRRQQERIEILNALQQLGEQLQEAGDKMMSTPIGTKGLWSPRKGFVPVGSE